MVILLEQGADLHMAQLMPLPLTVSCFSKIQIGFTFWYRLTWVVPAKGPLNGCVCVLITCYSIIYQVLTVTVRHITRYHTVPPTHLSTSGMNHACLYFQLQTITTLCLLLISCPTEDRRLSWPVLLGYIER